MYTHLDIMVQTRSQVKNQTRTFPEITKPRKSVRLQSDTKYSYDGDDSSDYEPSICDTEEYVQKPPYAVRLDFDEARKHWNANKRKLGNGCYEYLPKKRYYLRSKL